MAILNPKLNRGEISWKPTLLVAAITLAIVFPMAALRPQSAPTVPPQKAQTSKPAAAAVSPSSETPSAPAVHQEATESDHDEDAANQEEAQASRSAADAVESDQRAQEIAKKAAELARLAEHMKTGTYAKQIAELRATMAQISAQKDSQWADQLAALAESHNRSKVSEDLEEVFLALT